MSREDAWRLREGLVTRALDAETVILDLRASTYLTMNPVAAVIWRSLERGATHAEIVAGLLAEFEVTSEQASADVDEFLENCRRRGFLEPSRTVS